MTNKILHGYVENENDGFSMFELIVSDNGEWSVWENGELRDDIDEMDRITEVFGDSYYASRDHYKRNLPDSITTWIEENI